MYSYPIYFQTLPSNLLKNQHFSSITKKYTTRMTHKQTHKQTEIKAEIHENRQIDTKQKDIQTGGRINKQLDRQTNDKLTD